MGGRHFSSNAQYPSFEDSNVKWISIGKTDSNVCLHTGLTQHEGDCSDIVQPKRSLC